MAKPRAAEVEDQVPVKKLPFGERVTLSVWVVFEVFVYAIVILADGGTLSDPRVSKNSTVKLAEFPCWMLKGPLRNGMSDLGHRGGAAIIPDFHNGNGGTGRRIIREYPDGHKGLI